MILDGENPKDVDTLRMWRCLGLSIDFRYKWDAERGWMRDLTNLVHGSEEYRLTPKEDLDGYS